jgi:hypothetical protein
MQSIGHHVGPTIVRVFSESVQQPYGAPGKRTRKQRRGMARRLTRR